MKVADNKPQRTQQTIIINKLIIECEATELQIKKRHKSAIQALTS